MKKHECEDKSCCQCGKAFNRGRSAAGRIEAIEDFRKRRFCSQECYWRWNHADNHANYRDGLRHRRDGYVRLPDDTYLHRHIVSERLGRTLEKWEHVHHKDGNPSNNSPDNLQLLSNREHSQLHSRVRKRDSMMRFA